MRRTLSLPSLPGSLKPEVVAPDWDLPMGQIELISVLIPVWIVWNRTVYMIENRFGIDNLQWLMCHKTKPKQTTGTLSGKIEEREKNDKSIKKWRNIETRKINK